MSIRSALLALGLTASLTVGTAALAGPAAAAESPPERGPEFCAGVAERRAEAEARLADLQGHIDTAQDRLAERLTNANEHGRTQTAAVIQARLDRLAHLEVSYPAKVAEAFARVDAYCATGGL